MIWEKIGHIYSPENVHPWMHSHASNSVACHLVGDMFRVYFSTRDEHNVSSIGYIDVEMVPPFKVLTVADEPVLATGELGTFDDNGVSLSCITNVGGRTLLYYLGWNLGVTVPWRNSIGLAIFNRENEKFEKFSKAPLLDRCDVDPYSISYPFVLKDGNLYRMWYGSNLAWGREQKDMKHVIKYAESNDGIVWQRAGQIVFGFKNSSEYAMSRPCVIKEDGSYKMWYSYRGQSYRIGYAESRDGITWNRLDEETGIDVSSDGWDSEMICYPFVFDHRGQRYMLYNGNGYGRTGFGIARLVA